MFNDCLNLKIGWMVSMYIPVVPFGFDMAYPAELQNLCAWLQLKIFGFNPWLQPSKWQIKDEAYERAKSGVMITTRFLHMASSVLISAILAGCFLLLQSSDRFHQC